MKKILKVIISIISIIIILFIITYLIILSKTYKAVDIDEYLKSTDTVNITNDKNGIYFDGPGEDNLIIFYSGAFVSKEAYAKFMYNLADNGIDTYILDIPLNFAMLAKNKTTKVIKNLDDYNNYYVSGHSLGGVVATWYANDNTDKIKGIILFASYPDEKVNDNLQLLSIYGDKDGILNMDKYQDSKSNWPSFSTELIIEGGNHSNFGNYGLQKNDNQPSITNDEQQSKAIEFIITNLANN